MDIFDTRVSIAKRAYMAQHIWYFEGRRPKYNWAWVNNLEIDKLHQAHYEQTSEYKSLMGFFDNIEKFKP